MPVNYRSTELVTELVNKLQPLNDYTITSDGPAIRIGNVPHYAVDVLERIAEALQPAGLAEPSTIDARLPGPALPNGMTAVGDNTVIDRRPSVNHHLIFTPNGSAEDVNAALQEAIDRASERPAHIAARGVGEYERQQAKLGQVMAYLSDVTDELIQTRLQSMSAMGSTVPHNGPHQIGFSLPPNADATRLLDHLGRVFGAENVTFGKNVPGVVTVTGDPACLMRQIRENDPTRVPNRFSAMVEARRERLSGAEQADLIGR